MQRRSEPVARILLVEDDVELSTVLCRAARKSNGHLEVDWATDLRSARQQLRAQRYDAVLVDYCLGPNEHGDTLYSVCRDAQPGARFAIMSARPLEELLKLVPGRDLPLLPKPFTTDEFSGFVQALVEHRTGEAITSSPLGESSQAA